METWNEFLLVIVGMVALGILVGLAINYFRADNENEEIVEGNRQFVISSILRTVYQCYDDNKGRKQSVICKEFLFNSTEYISALDIANSIDASKIGKDNVVPVDMGRFGETVIRYENQMVFIEMVQHERIGS